jgi:hypothetical protein
LRLDTPTKRFIYVILSVIRAPYAFIVLSFWNLVPTHQPSSESSLRNQK